MKVTPLDNTSTTMIIAATERQNAYETPFIYKLNAMEAAASEADPAQHDYAGKRQAVLSHVAQLERALIETRREWDGLQAKIDALMLEYCPDEMTPEQIETWAKHQTVAPAHLMGEQESGVSGHTPARVSGTSPALPTPQFARKDKP